MNLYICIYMYQNMRVWQSHNAHQLSTRFSTFPIYLCNKAIRVILANELCVEVIYVTCRLKQLTANMSISSFSYTVPPTWKPHDLMV